MQRHGIPGASIAVVKDYTIDWASGFGFADLSTGRKVDTATAFQVASVSKPIAAIESFANHGVPLNGPIPPVTFPDGSSWTVANPYSQPVTAEQLPSHTAGIASFHYSGFTPDQVLPTLKQELNGEPPATTPAVSVVTEPGTTSSYAPGGYTILQAKVEQQNNWRPFDEIMDQHLLDKVPGLQHSSSAAPPRPSLAARMAVPHLPDDSPLPNESQGVQHRGLRQPGQHTYRHGQDYDFHPASVGRQAITGIGVRRAADDGAPGRPDSGRPLSTDCAAGVVACDAPYGLGFDVNVDSMFVDHIPDGEPTGHWFGHSGFNSGYLTFFLASKIGGNGLVLMLNAAPADMTTADIPEMPLAAEVIRRIADDQGWQG